MDKTIKAEVKCVVEPVEFRMTLGGADASFNRVGSYCFESMREESSIPPKLFVFLVTIKWLSVTAITFS